MAEGAAEAVTRPEPVHDLDEVWLDLHRFVVGAGEHTARTLFDDGEFDAPVEQGIRRTERVGLPDRDLTLFTVADGDSDVLECALDFPRR